MTGAFVEAPAYRIGALLRAQNRRVDFKIIYARDMHLALPSLDRLGYRAAR